MNVHVKNPIGRLLPLAVMVAGLGSGMAWAELPPVPALDGLTISGEKATSKKGIAQVELVNGSPKVVDASAKTLANADFGAPLTDGQIIQTGAQDRVLLRLDNGDYFHVGPESLLSVHKKEDGWSAQLWRGQVMAYALPELKGRKSPLTIHLPQGKINLRASKVGISSDGSSSRVLVFANEAIWQSEQGETTSVEAGSGLALPAKESIKVEPAMEEAMITATNPAIQVAKQATEAFQAKDYGTAKTLYSQLQTAYPYNGNAAYFLGLISLEQGKKQETVKQWKLYSNLEPEEAANREIPQKLTLLLTEQMKTEIDKALAIEKKFATGKPEPGTVAVSPLVNKGDEKYKILAKGLTAMIITDLAKVPGLKVLEREKMQKIMDELSLMKSGLVDEETQVRAGRIMRAEKVIVGDYAVK
ncbi:MAG: hypothetical protein G8345_08005 [Magnetococcales bacterium]|nr:FecR domain-containing protein [Magnetococcales bacterium]NGZ26818.1 hypothetical protein [Magnetococcales bacterium]